MSSEYERYVDSDFVTHLHPKEFASFNVLGFWKEKETMFPVLSRMAMDIISVQASSVASESAFSTSGRVLSIRRTRLTPASLEMCMCLKDHLDAKERKQDKCPLETPLDFEEGVFDDEVQQNEAIPLSDEEITLDASSEGTSLRRPQEEIRLVEKLLYDNSSPRPPEQFNSENYDAVIKSFSPSPIPVEGSDSLMEEIDIFLTPDDSMPPGMENDSEEDILFLEELLSNDFLHFLKMSHFILMFHHPLVLLQNRQMMEFTLSPIRDF
ncbi:zinc finger BED domain-containing protein RICESLEEPER 2 [Tanacetum coccineum]